MDKIKALSSFLRGFGRKETVDTINALFIAEKLSEANSPFAFENRDNNGVDSAEIRRLLIFNSKELEKQGRSSSRFYDLGKLVSHLNSQELKWVAQYIKNKNDHLFPDEASTAEKIIKELKEDLA
jgi:hypothetical protein